MKTLIAAGLIGTLVLAGCGTRLNPLNWFGGGDEERIAAAPGAFVGDPRPLVAEVTALQIERMPGGAIVRATGLPPRQGYWEVELVEGNPADARTGELIFEMKALEPLYTRAQTAPRSREVVVATYLSDVELAGVRSITVIGAENRRTARR